MKDEIKEIDRILATSGKYITYAERCYVLDYITNLQEQLHQASLDIQELTEKDIDCPSWCDKLTNLQQENKRLKDKYERCKKQKIKVENACSNYKYKLDKAIEYNQKIYDTSTENERLMAKINLNILEGEDNENNESN